MIILLTVLIPPISLLLAKIQIFVYHIFKSPSFCPQKERCPHIKPILFFVTKVGERITESEDFNPEQFSVTNKTVNLKVRFQIG